MIKANVNTERKILINNKTFLDFSKDIFTEYLIDYKDAPIEVKAFVVDLVVEITAKFYKKLFDVNINDDINIKEVNE